MKVVTFQPGHVKLKLTPSKGLVAPSRSITKLMGEQQEEAGCISDREEW